MKQNLQIIIKFKNLTRAFVTYVRPILEYSSAVWSPSLITLINKIESVQRNFTKRLPGLQNLNYGERKLKSLEHRRLSPTLLHATTSFTTTSSFQQKFLHFFPPQLTCAATHLDFLSLLWKIIPILIFFFCPHCKNLELPSLPYSYS